MNHNDLSEVDSTRLNEALAEWLEAAERGTPPDEVEYLRRYPEFAKELTQCIAAWRRFPRPGPRTLEQTAPVSGVLGDFRIVREVGRGGMGVVYEAEQISLSRRVALKVLPFAATLDARQLQRFRNEARAAAALHHDHIVPVYGVGQESGVHYYAMQFIDGLTLDTLIRRLREGYSHQAKPEPTVAASVGEERKRAPPEPPDTARARNTAKASVQAPEHFRKVAEWGIQIATALEYAHASGVIHRDIKPGNLMLDEHDKLWVTDFGLARTAADTGLTTSGDLVGTLRYMSPEQAMAKHGLVDHRTDIYALGVTLYELLTLQPAFGTRDHQELLRQIVVEEPPAPRRLQRTIPPELETIVLKAMEKHLEDRYATAQELAEDLKRFLKDEPIRARRPPLHQQLRRWAKRHRALMGATVVVLMALTVVLAVAGVWWRDRTIRQTETERVVNAFLLEADRSQKERNLPEALANVKQAKAILAGGTSPSALEQRVEARLADLQMLADLEKICLEHAGPFGSLQDDDDYVKAFRSFGLDWEVMSPEEVAGRIRERSVAVELANILDEWGLGMMSRRPKQPDLKKRLLETAEAIDPDPVRTRLRHIFLDKHSEKDARDTLSALLTQVPVEQLTPPRILAIMHVCDIFGPLEEGLRLLQQVQQRYPADFRLNWELGVHLVVLRPTDKEAALRCFAVAVALRPSDVDARYMLAVMLHGRGALDEAITAYQETLRLQPDHPKARQDLERALLARGPTEEDIDRFRETVRRQLNEPQPHYLLGDALLRQGRFDQAIPVLTRVLELKPSTQLMQQAQTRLGAALLMSGKTDDAIASLQTAVKLQDNAATLLLLSEAFQRKELVSEAISTSEQAIKLDPNNAAAHNSLAWILATTPNLQFRNPTRALVAAQKAVSLARSDGNVRNTLGVALYRNGEWQKALFTLNQAMTLRNESSGVDYFFLAMNHWQLGNKDQAFIWYGKGVEWLQKNKSKDPDSQRFWAEAAELLGIATLTPKGKSPTRPR